MSCAPGPAGGEVTTIARPSRPPARVSVFDVVQNGNCQLQPLFGRLHEGAMVSGVVIYREGLRGDPDHDPGRFFHWNTVDEVRFVLAAAGAGVRSGELVMAGRQHPVGGLQFDEPLQPGAFQIALVTQRQASGTEQRESMSFRCANCKHLLLRREFDSRAPADQTQPCFATISNSAAASREFNSDDAVRRCESCGHQNPPFPLEHWGWEQHAARAAVAADGRRTLAEAVRR